MSKSNKTEIGRKFNTLNPEDYVFYIDNHKNYKDFNTLGLYRSIVENEQLSLEDKIFVRDHAHKTFRKTFDFLQLKDPKTFIEVEYLGKTLTKGDEEMIWEKVKQNQERILTDKRIKHRNFGEYSKHNCGYETCPWNGLMIRQGSWLMESNMHFISDGNRYSQALKSHRRKADRKNKKQIIDHESDSTGTLE